MDFGSALAALGNASSIAQTLLKIDKSYDHATIKVQMAELYGSLADVKIALADAKQEIHERDRQIKELIEGASKVPGEPCPYCGERAMRMIDQGMNGVWERWQCEKCQRTEEFRHDLAGRKQTKRR